MDENENDLCVVTLSKPYRFENEEYTTIDLSPLQDMNVESLVRAERSLTVRGGGSPQIESNLAYCMEVAALATGKPWEFFARLPIVDGVAVKAMVQKAFFGLTG